MAALSAPAAAKILLLSSLLAVCSCVRRADLPKSDARQAATGARSDAFGDVSGAPSALLAVGEDVSFRSVEAVAEQIQPPPKIAVAAAVAGVALTGTEAFQPGQQRIRAPSQDGEAPSAHPAQSDESRASAFGGNVGPLQYQNEASEATLLMDPVVTPVLGESWRPVAEHFESPRLMGAGPEGFEVYSCRAKGANQHLEVHVMPLRNADDRARFRGEIAAHMRDVGSYLGWRREVNSSGTAHGLLVKRAAAERLSQVSMGKNMEKVWDRFKVAVQISKSLQAMSKAGYVHGALDPAMIWVDRDMSGSFRNALLAHRFPAIKKGTKADLKEPPLQGMQTAFIAPELRKEGGKFSEKTDVYSFGAVLFDLLVGHPPEDVAAQTSPAFVELDHKYPSIGQLLLECLKPTPKTRVGLAEALSRAQKIYGEEAMQSLTVVARQDLEGLPQLCVKPPWASGILDKMCKLLR